MMALDSSRRATMPYRPETPPDPLVPIFKALLRGFHEAPNPKQKNWFKALLSTACRNLEDFIEPLVSKAAWQAAQERGLGDIRNVHWDHQKEKMKDPERDSFLWEHYVPVSDLVEGLCGLADPSSEDILQILRKADIAWVLKEEGKELDAKHRTRRRDPAQAYSLSGIELETDFQPK